MNSVTIVIPNKAGDNPMTTMESLYRQTYPYFDIVVVNDFDGNANRARNNGLKMVETEFVLFSDNDIAWEPCAIAQLRSALSSNPQASYSYGWYEMEGKQWCNKPWDEASLKTRNYISTMSLVRTADHPGWDETIRRLQDWDVWLTMLGQGKKGVYTGTEIFSTKKRCGITYNSISWDEAIAAIKNKHKI